MQATEYLSDDKEQSVLTLRRILVMTSTVADYRDAELEEEKQNN